MHLLRETLTVCFFVSLLLPAQAASPPWWTTRGVIIPSKTADDYAAINQGQLKKLVASAVDEMNAQLIGGAGTDLTNMVEAWATNVAWADDYAVVTTGQLKHQAKPIYQRLLAAGIISSLPAWVSATASSNEDFAIANIGQAKHLFDFIVPRQIINDILPPAGLINWGGNLNGNNQGNQASPGFIIPDDLTSASAYAKHVPAKIEWPGGELNEIYRIASEVDVEVITSMSYETTPNDPLAPDGGDSDAAYETPKSRWLGRMGGSIMSPATGDRGLGYYLNTKEFYNYDIYGDMGNQNRKDYVLKTSSDVYIYNNRPFLCVDTSTGSTRFVSCPTKYMFRRNASRTNTDTTMANFYAPWIQIFPRDSIGTHYLIHCPVPEKEAPEPPLGSTETAEYSYFLTPEKARFTPFSLTDSAGPRYRKISLQGIPIKDSEPQSQNESGIQPEETFVDSYTTTLSHQVSDVFMMPSASLLPLQIIRHLSSSVSNDRFGLRFEERLDQPFGPGWSSNLCPHIEIESISADGLHQAHVTDEQGHRFTFARGAATPVGQWLPVLETLGNAKNFYNTLTSSTDLQGNYTFTLRKKFGTTCFYSSNKDAEIKLERNKDRYFVTGKEDSTYARMTLVQDRLGNRLLYDYPFEDSLIPGKIHDPSRPGLKITIQQKHGVITKVRGPSGETLHYEYEDLTLPTDHAASELPKYYINPDYNIPIPLPLIIYQGGNNPSRFDGPPSGTRTVKVLKKTTRTSGEDPGANAKGVVYSYDVDIDHDPTPDPEENIQVMFTHVDVSAITDEKGNLTQFVYRDASGHSVYDRTSRYQLDYDPVEGVGNPWRFQVGKPRQLQKIILPTHSASNPQIVQFQHAKMLQVDLNGDATAGEVSANGSPFSGAYTRVSGPAGTYDYKFTEPMSSYPAIGLPGGLLEGLKYRKSLSFKRMSITSAVGTPEQGTESFEFDPAASMALSKTTDLSGNVTEFRYTDGLLDAGEYSYILGFNGGASYYYDDPLIVISAIDGESDANNRVINGKKRYRYQTGTRCLKSLTDESGNKITYTFTTTEDINGDPVDDGTGRKATETYRDKNNNILKVIQYRYDNATFKGFITRQTVTTQGMSVPSGEQAPIGTMITEFVPDAWGRVKNHIVYAGSYTPSEGAPNPTVTKPLITSYTYTNNGQKKTVSDPREDGSGSYTTTFDYDPATLRLTATTFPDGSVKEIHYDDAGNIDYEVDETGFRTFYQYDELNRRTKTFVDLNNNGLKDSRYSPITFDANQLAPPVYDGDIVTEVSYNNFGLTEYETDARGIRTHHQYDNLGRRITTTANCDDLVSKHLIISYDYSGPNAGGLVAGPGSFNPTSITDPRGFVTEIEYDKIYRETRRELTDTSYDPPMSVTTSSIYNEDENKVIKKDALNRTMVTWFDGLGRVIREDFPSAATGTMPVPAAYCTASYTPAGQIWQVRDPLGQVTTHHYDNAGREIEVLSPKVWNGLTDGQGQKVMVPLVQSKAYDAAGNVVQTRDTRGFITDITYDSRNRATHVLAPHMMDPSDQQWKRPETTTEYDLAGRPRFVTDPLGNVNETRYDRAGRAVTLIAPPVLVGAATVPVPTITRSAYDAAGNVVRVSRPKGQETINNYDNLGLLKATRRDEEGPQTLFDYDKGGNQILVTDGENNLTEFAYDARGRLLWEQYPDIGDGAGPAVISYEYDALNQTAREDAQGRRTLYHSDVRGRLRKVEYKNSLGTLLNTRSLEYDALDQILTVSETANALAAVSYEYDAMGRLEFETSSGQEHEYRYDLGGNRTWIKYSTGREVQTAYDTLNRPKTIAEGGRTTRYVYDLAGRAVRMELGNGQYTRNVYDAQARLRERQAYSDLAAASESLMVELKWQRDANGNVTRQSETWPAGHGVPGSSQETVMDYDALDRLRSEIVTKTGSPQKVTIHGYDDADNRLTRTVTEDVTLTASDVFAYNERNQLESWTPLTGSPTVTYDYDRNGNRAERTSTTGGTAQTTSYQWDLDNRLIKVTQPDSSDFRYSYDVRSRRIGIAQGTSLSPPSSLTSVVFSGGLSVAEYQTPLTSPGTATLEVEYLRGPDMGGGVGGMLYSIRGSGLHYSLSNGRGDIVAQSDASKALTWTASYEAFGKRTSEAGSNQDRQRANTKDEDPTGLLNEGLRYRDLETGAWLSRDPAGFADGPNLYAYVRQNPWTAFDPLGLSGKSSQDEEEPEETPQKRSVWDFGGRIDDAMAREERLLAMDTETFAENLLPEMETRQQNILTTLPALATAATIVPGTSLSPIFDLPKVVGRSIFFAGGSSRVIAAETITLTRWADDVAETTAEALPSVTRATDASATTLASVQKALPTASRTPWTQVSSDARAILRDVEGRTGMSMPSNQRSLLAGQVRAVDHRIPVGDAQYRALQAEYRSSRSSMIADWQTNTGQVWPTGAQAHHIIPTRYGGPNQWWNIHPAQGSVHQGGIHGLGSPTQSVFPTPVPR